MAFAFTGQYAPEIQVQMRAFYETLSEKDGRRFAVLEAKRLGYGGITYIADVLGCSARTIERAWDELEGFPDDPLVGRIRSPGGGRKKKIESEPELELNLKSFVEARTAGDPDRPEFASIDFSPSFISTQLGEMGTPVSPHVVRDWLAENDFALHKIAKVIAGGKSPFRNAQLRTSKISSHSTSMREILCFPSIPKPKSDWGNSIAKVGYGRSSRIGHSTTIFPVGPRDW